MSPIPKSEENATMCKLAAKAQAAPRGGSLNRTIRQSSWWCQDIHLRGRVVSRPLIRAALAAVWLYQGLWCKLLGGCERHAEIVASLSLLGATAAHCLLLAIGGAECALAIWILAGVQRRAAAAAQTLLLAAMNGGALLWAGRLIADPAAMLLQNFAFLLLAWVAAEEYGRSAQGTLHACN
jgi:hypothetical protein